VQAHLILCFRAEEKLEMKRGEGGKMEIIKKQGLTGIDGWFPICEKNLPYELTVSFLLMPARPGFGLPLKLQEQHKTAFDLNAPLDERAGQRRAEWASGGGTKPAEAAKPATEKGKEEFITEPQIADLRSLADEVKADMPRFLKFLGVKSLQEIPATIYKDAIKSLEKKRTQP